MYLKNLVAAVEKIDQMPIEVEEMADNLIKAGCQDKIIFHPADEDPNELQGVFYQYTTRPTPYADPELTTLIAFSKHLDVEWQRMVCCKELIHTCDSTVEKTDNPDEVEALLEKVLGPLSTQDFGLADLMAAKDKLAIYQALAVLFPPQARDQAVAALKAGTKTLDEIAKWAVLPVGLVSFACSDDWPAVVHELVDSWE